jgi:prefoldin alpha subunit
MTKEKQDDKKVQELQQKYMQMQMSDQQVKQVQQQLEAVQTQIIEIQTILFALDDISKTEIGKEILIPLSSGIFVRAELKENRMLNVNVGSNTVVEKSVQETKALLERQITELSTLNETLSTQYTNTISEIEKLQGELQKLSVN